MKTQVFAARQRGRCLLLTPRLQQLRRQLAQCISCFSDLMTEPEAHSMMHSTSASTAGQATDGRGQQHQRGSTWQQRTGDRGRDRVAQAAHAHGLILDAGCRMQGPVAGCAACSRGPILPCPCPCPCCHAANAAFICSARADRHRRHAPPATPATPAQTAIPHESLSRARPDPTNCGGELVENQRNRA
jgi:hypothetical protein